jgi:hypothetical protein
MEDFYVYVRKEGQVSVIQIGSGDAYENSITTANPFGTSYSYSESAGEKYTCVINLKDATSRYQYFAEYATDLLTNPSLLPQGKYDVGVAARTVYDSYSNGGSIEWTDEAKQYSYKP